MTAQKKRLDVIAENMANRDTLRTDAGGPYRRKLTVFREIAAQESRTGRAFEGALHTARARRSQDNGAIGGVEVSDVIEDQSELIPVYDPSHPDADEAGYVYMPNVDTAMEMVDAMAATRSYTANIAVFEAIKHMANKALEIGK